MTHILTRKRGKCRVITYAVDVSRKLFVYNGIAADINYSIINASKTVECQVKSSLLNQNGAVKQRLLQEKHIAVSTDYKSVIFFIFFIHLLVLP